MTSLSRYPDPQGILNMKAKHDQSVRTLQRETVRARAAAIAEHIAAQPGWVTVVGTQPTGRKLRETWNEVVEDLAGRYVDARAQSRAAAAARRRRSTSTAETTRTARDAAGDLLARARAEAKARLDALLADPDNGALLQASVDAQRAAEQIELDTRPRWLTATLGERPVDPRLAERWDRLGRTMIELRDKNGITDEIDNGYSRADMSLRRAIGRFRRRRRPRPAAARRGHRPRPRDRLLSAADADAAHAANTRPRATPAPGFGWSRLPTTPEQQGTAACGWICSELAASTSDLRGSERATQREAMMIYVALCGAWRPNMCVMGEMGVR